MEKKPPIEISILLALMFFISLYTLISSTFNDGTIISILMINSIIIIRLFLVTGKPSGKATDTDADFEKVAKNIIENGILTYNIESKDKNVLLLKDVSFAFSEKIATLKIFANSLKETLNIKPEATELKNANEKIGSDISGLQNVSESMTGFSGKIIDFENILASSINLNDQVAQSSVEISQAVDSLYSSIDEVSAIVEETSLSIETITSNSEKLLSSTEETSAAMIELSSNARQSVSNAQEASNVALQMKSAAQEGNKAVQESVNGIKSLSETVIKAADVIENLGKNTQKIGDIVNVIREIAEQTNLLALNAAIEAARAGEHGRGFAVVADEVRKLAERSSLSTKEISALIKGIQTETLDAIDVVRGGTLGAEKATRLAQEAGQKINQFLDGVEYTAQLVEKIASSSIDQSGVSDIVAESISQMNTQVVQVSDAIKEQSIGVKHIVEALTEVKGMISQVQSSVYLQVNSSKLIHEVNDKSKYLIASVKDEVSKSDEFNINISSIISSITSLNTVSQSSSSTILKKLETSQESLNVIFEELNKLKTENNNKSLIQL